MRDLNFFSHERVSDRLYVFTEGYSMVHRFTIGVVVGDESILVIDAGLGATDGLRSYIERVVGTEKPLICASTHCHPDHVGSAKLFDEAYCSHLDWPARADFALNYEQRLTDLNAFCLFSQEVMEYCKEHIIDNSDSQFKDIKDGDMFDLGGVIIECISLPGHSDGSILFYNREENYVFSGDIINTDVHLKKLDIEGFKKYKKNLLRVIDILDEKVTIYPGHLPLPMEIEVAHDLVAICDDIISGNTKGDPPGETIFLERNNNPDIRMHFSGNTCVVYNSALTGTGHDSSYLNFYSHEKVGERVYVVTENYSMVHRFTIGVVIGDEKVVVIDSGMGMDGDLRTYIESFAGTDKPMICVCSHGAIDHCGAAILFDEAYLNSRDYGMLPSESNGAFNKERRLSDLNSFSLFNKEVVEYGRIHAIDNCATVFKDIDEGDEIDIGGIKIYPIRTPGHSVGHLAYWIPDEKIVFSGDAVNVDTHIKKLGKEGLLEYSQMLDRFLDTVGEDAKNFAGHLNRPHSSRVTRSLSAACREVAQGETENDPPGETIFLEKAGNTSMRMHYHGNCCIIYNSSLL